MDLNFKKDLDYYNKLEIQKPKNLLGLGLVSGGLDSLVACLVLKLQSIDIIGLNFKSPFCVCDKVYKNAECGLNLFYDKLGIKVKHLNKGDDYLKIVKSPKYGYGKNLNPCIDCRIYILKEAKKYAKKIGADFIFTGEVLNQRPKSQNRKALQIVEKEAGLQNELLRPLSALLLKPTIYEKKGLIDRSKLLDINGRTRTKQLEIARKYGLLNEYFACGGCLLTDTAFSNRMRDYFKFNKKLLIKDISILKYGRHFRYNGSKVVVGRNESENIILMRLKESNDIILEAKDYPSPISLIHGKLDNNIIEFAARVTLRYSDCKESKGYVYFGNDIKDMTKKILVDKISDEDLKEFII